MIRTDAGSECPQCRDTSHLVVPDKKTKGQTMSLKVKCNNGDCEWRGELVDYNKHITDKCSNRVVQCQYNCGLYFLASEVSVHEEEECTKRPYEVVVLYYEKQAEATREWHQQQMNTVQTKQQQQMSILEEKHKQEKSRLEEKYKERLRLNEDKIKSLERRCQLLNEGKLLMVNEAEKLTFKLKHNRTIISKLEHKQTTYSKYKD